MMPQLRFLKALRNDRGAFAGFLVCGKNALQNIQDVLTQVYHPNYVNSIKTTIVIFLS